MGFRDWVTESGERFRREPARFAAKCAAQELLMGVLRRFPDHFGKPVWEKEWDVLVVLDACRFDVFNNCYSDASWLASLNPTMSVGSASPEWMEKTFSEEYSEEMASTAYVTGNPYSTDYIRKDSLGILDEVWRYVWDDNLGTIPPEPLTNQAVAHYRTNDYQRLIVHYMQPHWPYITDPIMYGFDPEVIIGEGSTSNPFDRQNRGTLSREEHIGRYRSNLEYVVDHVREVLLNAIDADVVALTADHATLFGEYGLYKHPAYVPLPLLRRVPWAVTTARDEGGYEPEELSTERQALDIEREEQLHDLGYVQ